MMGETPRVFPVGPMMSRSHAVALNASSRSCSQQCRNRNTNGADYQDHNRSNFDHSSAPSSNRVPFIRHADLPGIRRRSADGELVPPEPDVARSAAAGSGILRPRSRSKDRPFRRGNARSLFTCLVQPAVQFAARAKKRHPFFLDKNRATRLRVPA